MVLSCGVVDHGDGNRLTSFNLGVKVITLQPFFVLKPFFTTCVTSITFAKNFTFTIMRVIIRSFTIIALLVIIIAKPFTIMLIMDLHIHYPSYSLLVIVVITYSLINYFTLVTFLYLVQVFLNLNRFNDISKDL